MGPELFGIMGEFDEPEALILAAKEASDAGYRKMDAYTPMPVEGLADALGFENKVIAPMVFIGGLTGAVGGFSLCWWMTVVAYPHIVAGRQLNSWPAYVAITFECMILLAATTAVFGMLALNKLPQPYHPVFNAPRFERASRDKFFLCIEAEDPLFDSDETRRFLERIGASEVVEVAL